MAAILDEADKFASEVLAPLNRVGDIQGCRLEDGNVATPAGWQEAYRTFRAGGWPTIAAPHEYGGQGMPKLVAAAVMEMWQASNLAFSLMPLLSTGAAEALQIAASEPIKQKYLPKLVSGQWGGTMNLTEPQAGSDLAALRARAEPAADGSYRIFGQKIFITYGEHQLTDNILHLVLARLPDAPPGVKGISLFLVPKYLVNDDGALGDRNDVRCVSVEHKLGIHASPTCVMAYGDNSGAIGYLVGEPSHGLEYMFVMMNEARFGVGLQGIAIAERAYQQALAYAHERIQGRDALTGEGSVPIAAHPDVRRMLMLMQSRTQAARMLAYWVVGQFDVAHAHTDAYERERAHQLVDFLIPIVKGWSTEVGNDSAYLGVQIHGGMGFVEETGAAQHMRDARILTIYEGTTGIQANDLLTRKLLRDNGSSLKQLLACMRADLDSLRSIDDQRIKGLVPPMEASLVHFESAALSLIERGKTNLGAVMFVAVPFLMLAGTVCGAWQWGKAVLAASRRLGDGTGDARFHREQIELAHFYMAHVATGASALAETVAHGAHEWGMGA
ncbi:MAG: acyl-CoA dehydrogenase [Aromatoleum sp.]|jgi:alkylation response protein AidB-like acyl-CoA dehydrogenase|uniref:acyl-CoA dehydrogenase n=1 Tax=Aromatoleum sp. TaxID=2307007 RepID=UPI0028957EFA|nr:acyl-CoA dehydrogenase [Aromatoleum sp.]MDT3671742.1 acyl-CoA dehydrogenase [Aromatoleum sp.]